MRKEKKQVKPANDIEITDIKLNDGWLELYLKDKFNGKPMYVEAKVLTDKIRPMLH